MQDKIDKLIIKYKNSHKYLAEGRNRIVFIKDDDWVIKLPLHEAGTYDQYEEEDRYTNDNQDGIFAKCYTVKEDGIPVLYMERVTPVLSSEGLPDWVKSIDCQQVGYTKDGRLVAYDSAYN